MLELQNYNKHWKKGYSCPFKKKRHLFGTLTKLIKKRQILAVTGMRRTGKTVLMKQIIGYIIAKGTERQNILYFSFDKHKPEISKLVEEYIATTDVDLDKDKTYLFLDEVQKLKNWQEQVKVIYDNNPNVKIFVTGSVSLFIRKKATESLAGRVYLHELPILNFKEFLMFRDKEDLLEKPKMHAKELKRELAKYMKRSFIEIIDEDAKTAELYMKSIINKIVYEDIPAVFPIENPDKLKAIVRAVYSRPGMIIKYEQLGDDLGLSAKTVEKYLFYLLQAKLIKKLYNFSRNFLTSEKKLKKFYVVAPCFCFLNDNYKFSEVAENIASLQADFFWRDSHKNEVDLVLKKGKKPLPVEVKFKRSIRSGDKKGLKKFMSKFKVSKAVMLTKNLEKRERNIKYVPLWKWLLAK